MRWLFRIMMVGLVVMLFLPGNEPERAMVFEGLKSAFWKTLYYCDRQPEFCNRSRAAFYRVTQSAKQGLQEIAAGSRPTDRYEDSSAHQDSRNTLGGSDYEPQWRLP